MRLRVSRVRAVSLIELVVASAIALILALVLTRLFQSSLAWQARNLRRTSLQQQMMLSIKRITGELQQSAPTGITVGPNQLAVQKVVDVTADLPPRQIWETALVTYFVNSRGLYRRQWPPQPPNLSVTLSTSQPFHPDPTQLSALSIVGGSTLIGRNVSALRVSSPNTLPLTLSLTVAEENETFSTVRTISLRNAE